MTRQWTGLAPKGKESYGFVLAYARHRFSGARFVVMTLDQILAYFVRHGPARTVPDPMYSSLEGWPPLSTSIGQTPCIGSY
jgi:hypothetical protein